MALAAAVASGVRFALTIVDGRAVLASPPEGDVGDGLGRLDRIALEVPGLRFPFDLTQGPRAFQTRRCRLADFAFSIAPGELGRWLAGARLERFGLSAPAVALGPDGGLRLGLRASVAGREAEITAKVTVAAQPGARWRIALADARVHGFVPVPAPLLLAGLCTALDVGVEGSHWALSPPALLAARGLTEWDVALVDLVLTARLGEAGWRLPSREGLAARPAGASDGRVVFALARETDADAADDHVAERGLAALAEAALSAGELRPAVEGFRRALAAEPDNDFARERLFQLLASMPDAHRELESLCDEALVARPGLALARVGRAVVAAERGRHADAAALYLRLADDAAGAGEPLDEAAACMAAAEQHQRGGDAAAAGPLFERVLALRPDHAATTRALAGMRGGDPA